MNAEQRVAMVAGASGLVGGHLVRALAADPRWTRIVAVARRRLDEAPLRVSTEIVDFARLDGRTPPDATGGETVVAFCALGTTIKAAGSEPAFRAVDLDAALAFARYARRAAARSFVLVSSVGANPGGRNFYLRVKGELEQAVATLGFESVTVLRPSLLLGARADARGGEAVAQRVLPLAAPLLLGPLRRYRAIDAKVVAAAMAAGGVIDEPGQRVWEHDAIAAHARSTAAPAV